jgi:hypothetical protein
MVGPPCGLGRGGVSRLCFQVRRNTHAIRARGAACKGKIWPRAAFFTKEVLNDATGGKPKAALGEVEMGHGLGLRANSPQVEWELMPKLPGARESSRTCRKSVV